MKNPTSDKFQKMSFRFKHLRKITEQIFVEIGYFP